MVGSVDPNGRVAAPRFDDLTLVDPYPFYAQVRAQAGLCWSDALGGWLVGRHDDIRDGLAHPQLSAERLDTLLSMQFATDTSTRAAVGALNSHSMFFLDPPRQTAARACVSSAFKRHGGARLETAMADHARDLARTLVQQGQADLVGDYALPLSIALMGEMMQVDAAGRRDLRAAVDTMIELFGGGGDGVAPEKTLAALRRLEGFVRAIAASDTSADDTVFGHVQALARERALDEDQLVGLALDLMAGGYVPLTNLIANTLCCLLQAPDQLAALRATPSLVSQAVEEGGRFEAPNQITSRIAAEDLQLAGTAIAKGDLVFFLLASGNRDPALCHYADRFNLYRPSVRALTFGSGSHACIAARVGARTAEAAISALLDATTEIDLDGPLRWSARTLRVRGLQALPVRLS